MLRRVFASLTLTCACLVVANAKAEISNAEALPTPFEVAHMAYQGQFTGWGIPAAGTFCYDVNSVMLIHQDLAYAYLLESGFVDSLLTPTEGAIISQGQTQAQGQAQVKGKDVPVSQGQTQAQGKAQVKGKDVPVSQGQTQAQGQAQVKGKDVPVSQGQTQAQGQAQVKGKDIPVSQGQTQAQGQAQVKGKDLPVSQGQTQAQGQAQVKGKDVPVSQGKLMPSQQQQIQTKGKLIPNQQGQSSSMIARSDLDIRRFVDYTNALTDDEVRLVRENFDEQFLRDLSLQMRYMCNE